MKLVNQGGYMGKDNIILPEEDGDSDTNLPPNKNTKNKKVHKNRGLTKFRRFGLVNDTIEIKISSS